MQRDDPPQAHDVKSSARAGAQLAWVSAVGTIQIGEMVFQKLEALGFVDVDVRMIITAMAGKGVSRPAGEDQAKRVVSVSRQGSGTKVSTQSAGERHFANVWPAGRG